MNLNQFEYLLMVYKERSITNAARQLFVSAPAISNAVKALEDELGYPILIRHTGGVEFTEQGEEVIEVLQEIQKKLQYLKQIKREELSSLSGEFALGGTMHFNNSYLYQFLFSMNQKYPQLRLHLQSSDSEAIISAVGASDLDFGIIIITELDEPNMMREIYRNQLEYVKIAEDEMRFVVRKEHPFLRQDFLTVQQLFQYPYICYVEKVKSFVPFFSTLLLKHFDREVDALHCADEMKMLRINDSENLYKMLENTDGFTLMPYRNETYVKENHPNLCYLDLHGLGLKCNIVLIRKKKPMDSEESQIWNELQDFLTDSFLR